MKSHSIASILSAALAFLPNAVHSALAWEKSIVSCTRIDNPTDSCTFHRAEELLTWFDHNSKATQMGCTLASIISEEEQAQVEALYDNNTDPTRTRIWIGAFKESDEWQWSDGSAFHYTNWNVNEPSNQANETHAHLMFPAYPESKMKWNDRWPTDTLAALYKCCNGDDDHQGSNSANSIPSSGSFEVCASSSQYSPSPYLVFENGTVVYEAGSWGHDFTIYKSSAEGLNTYPNEENIPNDAKTNIIVYVNRRDDNTCTVDVNDVACNSCLFCDKGGGAFSSYSADCTNIEHGRIVECESAEFVFFPLTEAALMNE